MKRFHVHVGVDDLDVSVQFYSTLFATEPTVLKPDYAKWMLEDPRVNFAISKRAVSPGIEHLGIQAENEIELAEVYDRLSRAERPVLEDKATTCCYANSDKQWIADPQGVAWETFLTKGEATVYGRSGAVERLATSSETADAPCCTPSSADLSPAKTAPRVQEKSSCGCGTKTAAE
jgi:hypothetical protein